mgnify:FL=1
MSFLHPNSLVAHWDLLELWWFVEIHWDIYGECGVYLPFVCNLPMLDACQDRDLLSLSLYLILGNLTKKSLPLLVINIMDLNEFNCTKGTIPSVVCTNLREF